MKLFIKEHAFLFALQCVQFSAILVIYWLDGYRNYLTGLYSVFLGLFFLTCYLIYKYISHRPVYQRLSQPVQTLDESLTQIGSSPLATSLNELLQQQYKLYHEQIEAAERKQEEHLNFIDRWVHQMKTPLSVIEFSVENLDEPELSNIREETERMKTGLNTVLYMARLRTIEQDFHIKPVDLAKLVHEVNQENKRFYIRNHVYPQLNQQSHGITVETDEKWLFFMLSQLINNAVKYSAKKSNQVVISIYEKEKSAVLEVKDFGVGIPQTDMNRIFNAFYTGENGRKYRESTGMGLYLTKEVSDHLEHCLEMESEVDNGTTFRIIFTPSQNITTM